MINIAIIVSCLVVVNRAVGDPTIAGSLYPQ